MLTTFLSKPINTSRFLLFTLFTTFCFNLPTGAQQPSSQATVKSGFSARLMNIEAAANETFRYNATLNNGSGQQVIYELKTDLPAGWLITYRVEGSQVTSLNMEPGKTQDISIEINSTATASPNKYNIPVRAISSTDTLTLYLEAVVKGSYSMSLSTPTGRLSEEITSGSQKEIQLVIKNTGTLPLNDVNLTSQLPANWEALFEPATIKQLEPGKTTDVKVSLKVPDKTIAGDYAATFKSSNSNNNSEAQFRIIVKTSLLSGWIGVIVILLAIGIVYYLIRKYGRR